MPVAIVLGSGAGCWDEFAAAREMLAAEPIVIACNHAFRDAPFAVAHAVSMHSDQFPRWLAARRAAGLPDPQTFWRPNHRPPPKEVPTRSVESWGGSSGLLCVAVAFELGCERIVLAGVPMHKHAQHYDIEKDWIEARQYWPAWERMEPRMRGRVRSMSGWTLQLLGPPTEEWLGAGIA